MDRRTLLTALFGLPLAAACGRSTNDELPPLDPLEPPEPTPPLRPPVSGTVRVASDLPEAVAGVLRDALKAGDPDLKVVWLAASAFEGADLVFLRHAQAARTLAAQGALARWPESVLEATPDRFHGLDGRLVGVAVRARVFVARRLMANRPLSVLDLGDGRWRGTVARAPATGLEPIEQIAATLAVHGEGKTGRFLGGFRRNTREEGCVRKDAEAAMKAVLKREVALAWVDHDVAHRALLPDFDPDSPRAAADGAVAEASVEVLLPDRDTAGVPWSATVIAPLRGGDPARAEAVALTLLSEPVQRTLSGLLREYPVLDHLPGPAGAPDRTGFAWNEVPLADRAEWVEDAQDLAGQMELPPEPLPTPQSPSPPKPETGPPVEPSPGE